MVILLFIFLIAIFSVYISPFPFWKTYFLLWRIVLFRKQQGIGIKTRLIQTKYLSKYFLYCPIFALFWLIDEIFYSQYKNVDVKPLFIIGQPRSGTTFLHRTLAHDSSSFLAIKHIEWRYPFISFQKLLNKFDFLKILSKKNYWPKNPTGQMAAKMHPNVLSDWEEDGIFFEECFLHHFFIFLRFPYPDLLTQVDDFALLEKKSQTKFLEIHQKVIKKMIFLHNAQDKYYLSKEVTGHSKLPHLHKMYPNAKLVVCVRNADGFMNSLLPLVKYSTEAKNQVDPTHIKNWEECFVERMQNDSILLLDMCNNVLPIEKQTRITFNEVTSSPKEAIEYIYADNGFTLTNSYSAYLDEISISQRSRKKGYNNGCTHFEGFSDYDKFVDSIKKNIETVRLQDLRN